MMAKFPVSFMGLVILLILAVTLVTVAYQLISVADNANVTPIVKLLELQLSSYYRPSFHGFLCFPSPSGGTDFYDYWPEDNGKVLTAFSVIRNYTLAYEAFNFLYGLRAYGYMMPDRVVQTMLNSFNGYYGNNIIAAGGCPLSLGTELFGFNYVTSLISINGVGGCAYTTRLTNESVVFNFGGKAVVIINVNDGYFLVKPVNGNLLTLTLKPPAPVAYVYSSNLSLVSELVASGLFRGVAVGVASFTNTAPFTNNPSIFVIGNVTMVRLNSSGLTITANGGVKVYAVGVGPSVVDYGTQPYIMLGLLLNKYPSNAEVGSPASFGYIALGSALLGLETHNETVLSFARGFVNFWLPIVKEEIKSGVFYPRSVSTFLVAALLLEPGNETIRQLALSYVESPVTLSAVEGGATGYGLTAWLISLLDSMGYSLGNLLGEYYRAQVHALGVFKSTPSPPLPIDYAIPYKAGEDLFGWLEAGLPYNDTGVVLPLINIVFNDVLAPGSNPPPFYAFFNYANTEGVPAILEAVAVWQARMLNETGLTINRWRYLNVTKLSVAENASEVIVDVEGYLMPPSGIITHLELYIPFNPLNVTVMVNNSVVKPYLNQSMYVPTQYYLTFTPQVPTGWFFNKTTHMLYIQYIPEPTAVFNHSAVDIKVILKPSRVSTVIIATSQAAKPPSAINWVAVVALVTVLIIIIVIAITRFRRGI